MKRMKLMLVYYKYNRDKCVCTPLDIILQMKRKLHAKLKVKKLRLL